MLPHIRPFVVIQARPAQSTVVECKSKGFNEVEPGATIGAQTDDIACVWRYFRFEKDDIDQFMISDLSPPGSLLPVVAG